MCHVTENGEDDRSSEDGGASVSEADDESVLVDVVLELVVGRERD